MKAQSEKHGRESKPDSMERYIANLFYNAIKKGKYCFYAMEKAFYVGDK